jgi:hypothetical protein
MRGTLLWLMRINLGRPPFPHLLELLSMDHTGTFLTNFEPFFLTLLTRAHHYELESAYYIAYLEMSVHLEEIGYEDAQEEFREFVEKFFLPGGTYEDMYIYSTTQE